MKIYVVKNVQVFFLCKQMIVQMFARVFQAEDMHFVHVLYVQECANIFCAKYLLCRHELVQWCGWCSMLSVCILCRYGKPLIEKWSVQGGSGGGVNACLDGLGLFFCPRPNGQCLVLGGVRKLVRMVCALFSSTWQSQKNKRATGPFPLYI